MSERSEFSEFSASEKCTSFCTGRYKKQFNIQEIMIQREHVVERPLMIALQDIEHNILKHVNLHIKAGEIYSIIGKNDSGKSEVLRCINRISQPKYGKITIDNQNLNLTLKQKESILNGL